MCLLELLIQFVGAEQENHFSVKKGDVNMA